MSISYGLSAAAYSLLFRIQSKSHDDALKTVVPQSPIFLLGFWRSGTTFLHELFCCDSRFGFPSTYACLNPSHFLLTEQWIKQAAQEKVRRPMDDMNYSWTSPQEDEFALLALGAPSVYQALLVPSLMRNPSYLLDLRKRPKDERERWKSVFVHFMKLLTIQQRKPMVLKSPPHGFKLALLVSLFPTARYVVIERNPYEVFASNVKLWRSLLELYSLESISTDEIENFVLAAYILHEKALEEGSRRIDPGLITRVRYEELAANPVEQMARIYQELELGEFEGIRPSLEDYREAATKHRRNRFRLSVMQKNRIDEGWGELISKKGYDWGSDYITLE